MAEEPKKLPAFLFFMKKVYKLLFLFLVAKNALAVTAYPFPIFISSPSGGLTIFLHGNQNFKYAVTSDGFPLLHDGNNWFFAASDEQGNLYPSLYKAETVKHRNNDLKLFLEGLQKEKILEVIHKLAEQSTNINRKRIVQYTNQRKSLQGQRKALIVLMQFADVKFMKSHDDFDALFNSKNYTIDGAKGSVWNYYNYVSYGLLDLQSDIIGPFNAQHEMKYYGGNVGWGGNDKNPYALFQEALQKAADTVNLSDYDIDGDGFLDNIHIIYAGYGEEAGASSDAIWAHENIFDTIEKNGIKIDRYSCAPELRSNHGEGISRIGPHCHEIGHALGAMDYYDTDYNTGGYFSGTGKWDVMASGSWNNDGISPANFNPYTKAYDFGWCQIENVSENNQLHISPSSYSNKIYRINSSNPNEFFLLENRQQEYFDKSSPGHGLLIFHVSDDIEKQKETNTINSTYPQTCYVVCASSGYRAVSSNPSSYGDIDSGGCPFPGETNQTVFDYYSIPAALCNTGNYAGFSITSILENEDNTINLNVRFDNEIQVEEPQADGKIIWKETFDDTFLNSFWAQENIEGNNSWKIQKSLSITNQNGWLQLAPTFSPFDSQSKRIVTRLKSSSIEVSEGEYVLSLKMSCANIKEIEGAVDSIKISFYNHGIYNDISYSFPVFTEVWAEHAVLINESMLPIEFSIDGICYRNSILMIDDIVIQQKNENDTFIKHIEDEKTIDTIYTISGMRVTLEYIRSHPGFYIVNGKKYFLD